MVPPAGVNLMAFEIRLLIAWKNLLSSISTKIGLFTVLNINVWSSSSFFCWYSSVVLLKICVRLTLFLNSATPAYSTNS
ncbi:hypothetical protein, partial [uncultured Mucilaginibacter sp.]|uniref:hypothetical protein n=1 Tax=uncultured Mucilaginibacter sp. TaxID=797541 RepID=UPI002618B145